MTYSVGLADSIYLYKYTDELVEIEIANKFKIKCTPDHLFMMRTSEYCKT
ncbi:MAG: hypothetical protein LBF68_06495 [Christensenellaceae bacterium]|nr:hypothetical protein [Christensenellaceae bacterium]